MIRLFFLLPLAVLGWLVSVSFIVGEESITLNWPVQAESKIAALIEVKREAMSLPGMRSSNGTLGKRAEVIIAEIASLVDDPEFVSELKKASLGDIRAKIALWSLDRRERPDEYIRFAKWYVSGPLSMSEKIDYYSLLYTSKSEKFRGQKEPWEIVPRLTHPHAVEEHDSISANRMILEYCFFMPPTGYRFQEDYFRGNLLEALISLENPENSLSVFREDAYIYNEVCDALPGAPYSDDGLFATAQVNSEGVFALVQLPGVESFESLSSLYSEQRCRSAVVLGFSNSLTKNRGIPRNYENLVELNRQWMRLSKLDWKKASQRVFAEWLKTVPIKEPDSTETSINPF